jgi:hypothetical protein
MKLTHSDRAIVAEHVGRLRELAQTHREFAAQSHAGSDCRQTSANAAAAAKKTERLAKIIETMVGEAA